MQLLNLFMTSATSFKFLLIIFLSLSIKGVHNESVSQVKGYLIIKMEASNLLTSIKIRIFSFLG